MENSLVKVLSRYYEIFSLLLFSLGISCIVNVFIVRYALYAVFNKRPHLACLIFPMIVLNLYKPAIKVFTILIQFTIMNFIIFSADTKFPTYHDQVITLCITLITYLMIENMTKKKKHVFVIIIASNFLLLAFVTIICDKLLRLRFTIMDDYNSIEELALIFFS